MADKDKYGKYHILGSIIGFMYTKLTIYKKWICIMCQINKCISIPLDVFEALTVSILLEAVPADFWLVKSRISHHTVTHSMETALWRQLI